VLWVKETALKLDEVLSLLERDSMSDEAVIEFLARCQLDPRMPQTSLETLLHAFIAAPHVQHTHPDAINVLACTRDGERLVSECFGDAAAWIPYIPPGFTLATRVAEAMQSKPGLIVLARHGLIVWGDSIEEADRRTSEVIDQAVAFVNQRAGHVPRFGGRLRFEGSLHELLPVIRGAVSSEAAKVLTVDTSERVLEFVSSVEAESLVNDGARWVPYYQRDRIRELADRDVILVEGLGMVTAATSTTAAKLARDRYHRTIEVMAGAQALGGFVSFDADIELVQARPPAELQGRVALVTGAAGGIGRAIADALSAAGACVVAFDLDGDGAQEAVAAFGDRGLAVAGDVTSEHAVAAAFAASVDAFGGVDIVVSNAGIASSAPIEDTSLAEWNRNHAILGTGYFLVAREAFRVLKRQGIGGSIVFVASKNALVAGKNAAAYSSAKAAELHLARCLAEEGGAHGIRVNTVNPDAVLRGSKIWDSSWRKGRAVAYNIEPDELDEHYRKRTTLGVNIFPEDIAEAVMHFASGARSGKSTGNVLNVDGGVPAAYAR
jgi:NAD(P)-dependent dehydrogenase (short-subunit alcohol dehydrogenase family)